MKYITDLEVHSKYARVCSPNSDLEHHGEYTDKILKQIIIIQTIVSIAIIFWVMINTIKAI
jgi:hypothetical protein